MYILIIKKQIWMMRAMSLVNESLILHSHIFVLISVMFVSLWRYIKRNLTLLMRKDHSNCDRITQYIHLVSSLYYWQCRVATYMYLHTACTCNHSREYIILCMLCVYASIHVCLSCTLPVCVCVCVEYYVSFSGQMWFVAAYLDLHSCHYYTALMQ